MKQHIFPAIRLTLVCALLFCAVYPLAIWSIAQLAPGQGKGKLLRHQGNVYLQDVGQAFVSDTYFWPRPSAAGYNAAATGGSNKGPGNPEYLAQVRARIDTFMAHHPDVERGHIPGDLITASGSGIDPHLSVEAVLAQAVRVAAARKTDESALRNWIRQQAEPPVLGLFGPKKIHLLKLNLALDQKFPLP